MKKIQKADIPPPCLTDFIEGQQSIEPEPVNLTYSDFQNPGRRQLRETLTREQFGLCGYTGAPVDEERISALESPSGNASFTNHIEHLKCQDKCKEELAQRGEVYGRDLCEDLDYYNMIAALEIRGAECERFGAVYKGNKNLPILPTHDGCEERLRFQESDGEVEGLDDDAIKSINVLRLNHITLTGWRKATIAALLDPEVVTTREDLETIQLNMENPVDGRLPAYAFVIASIIREYLQ